jgi:heme exporter protein D
MIMELGPHAAFIVAAYGAALGIIATLIVWVVLDRRHLDRVLHELELQGISRRSERAGEERP